MRPQPRCTLPLICATLLTSCGGEPEGGASADAVAPTSYSIDAADLHRSVPNDICRSRNRNFLQMLISRARRGVPSAQLEHFEFEDFNVTDGFEGKGREATLRFRVAEGGAPRILMYAIGSIDPSTCTVGELRVGVGASPYEKSGTAESRVP